MSAIGERIRKVLDEQVYTSVVWRSVFRHGFPDTDRNRTLVVLSNLFLHLHPAKLKGHAVRMRYTWCMGGLSFFMFLILTISGVFLMFYYRPTPEYAYADIIALREDVPLGMFMRNIHRWAAHAMVACVMLHMARAFYTAAYKGPRRFNWVIGMLLFVLTLGLSFTGYLLPWDQLAYWAVTVGTEMAAFVPLIGDTVKDMMLGGPVVSSATLLRFYVLHVAVLPVALVLVITIHLWRWRKDSMLDPGKEVVDVDA